MAIQSQPSRISEPFAGSGSKNAIPATNAAPSASQAASWASGFPPECSQPISAGGCPVPRNDFNGVLNQLSQDYAFRQDGGIWAWSAVADYEPQRVVRGSDGLLYFSKAQSGPGFASGAKDPVSDTARTYWTSLAVPSMPSDDSSNAVASTAWVSAWRTSLVIPDTLYVDAVNGNDANDGSTALSALKTIGEAERRLSSTSYIAPKSVTINLAAGTYTDPAQGASGCFVEYVGPDAGTAATIPYFSISDGNGVSIGGRIATERFSVARGASVRLKDNLDLVFDYSLVTSPPAHAFYVYISGIVSSRTGTSAKITFDGAWSFSTGTIHVAYNATFAVYGSITWVGSVTGKKFYVFGSSSVSGLSDGSGIPGDAAGYIDATSYIGA